MEQKKGCINCGYVKPKVDKVDLEKEKYCSLCDEKYKLKDYKQHKEKEIHILKLDVIKQIKKLDGKDENNKKKILKLSKSLSKKSKPTTNDNNTKEN